MAVIWFQGGVKSFVIFFKSFKLTTNQFFSLKLRDFVGGIRLGQRFSNCASRRPGASFQFSKSVTEYFGIVP